MIKAADPNHKDLPDGTFLFDKAHVVMSGLVTKKPVPQIKAAKAIESEASKFTIGTSESKFTIEEDDEAEIQGVGKRNKI